MRDGPTASPSDLPFALTWLRSSHKPSRHLCLSRSPQEGRDIELILVQRQRRLLEHTLYSTYWDCVRLDMRDDAQEILGMPASTAG